MEGISNANQSLGKLAQLPLETRNQIWKHLPIRTRIALLCTSHQTYSENMSNVYKDVDIQFNIQPTYQYKSWLSVEWKHDRWQIEDLKHAFILGLHKIPFDRLREIQINIEAPDVNDAGQLICLHKKCLDLAELLERAKNGLPHLEINLVAPGPGSWGSASEPQHSIPELDSFFTSDYEIILHAFCRLRHARSARVRIPAGFERRYRHVGYFERTLLRKEPFGTVMTLEDPNDLVDSELQEETNDLFLGMDLRLDLLPGPIASMLRMDRFSHWYKDKIDGESSYEQRYKSMMEDWIMSTEESTITPRLQWRYGAMRVFDPLRWDQQKEYRNPRNQLPVRSTRKEEWDEHDWYSMYGRQGIPPFDSLEFAYKVIHTTRRGIQMEDYEEDFANKLQGWKGGSELYLVDYGIAWHARGLWKCQKALWLHLSIGMSRRSPRKCPCNLCSPAMRRREETGESE
ncbi:MAG: hypothetical protein L6R41_002560 [Letrouitia leprolyta]|nr:MAG: hypothetical protein L6R41_002560 [Letrouitia leprolyta]